MQKGLGETFLLVMATYHHLALDLLPDGAVAVALHDARVLWARHLHRTDLLADCHTKNEYWVLRHYPNTKTIKFRCFGHAESAEAAKIPPQ